VGFRATRRYSGILNALTEIRAREGVAGLYKGLGPTVLACAPFVAAQQASARQRNAQAHCTLKVAR